MAFETTLPSVLITGEPQWATDLNAVITELRNNRFSGSSGHAAKLSTVSLNIDDDLELNGNALTEIKGLRLQALSDDLETASDVNTIYSKNDGNLYYNNGSQTSHVQITNGNSLFLSVGTANILERNLINSNDSIGVNDTPIYYPVDTSAGSFNISLPSADSVNAGRYIIVSDIDSNANTNNITLVRDGSDTINSTGANYIIDENGITLTLISDGTSNWEVYRSLPDNININSSNQLDLGGTTVNLSVDDLDLEFSKAGSRVDGYSVNTVRFNSGTNTELYADNNVVINSVNETDVGGTTVNLSVDDLDLEFSKAGSRVDGYSVNTVRFNSGTNTELYADSSVVLNADTSVTVTTPDFTVDASDDVVIDGNAIETDATTTNTVKATSSVIVQSPTLDLRAKIVPNPTFFGRTIIKIVQLGTGSSQDLHVHQNNYFVCAVLSGASTWDIIEDDTPVEGDWFIVVNRDNTNSATIREPGPSTVLTLNANTFSLLYYDGSFWNSMYTQSIN